MSTVDLEFKQAEADVRLLETAPDNATLLKLYGLYKQATEGDVSGEPPELFDVRASAKYKAWQALVGTSRDDAKRGVPAGKGFAPSRGGGVPGSDSAPSVIGRS
ncbi:MAG: acyl-CoA-binding protein [Hyphomicrobiaceae bacterium]|nr:acyl-CoA-binding protein [Hyphomicrobiaceae bacterium]